MTRRLSRADVERLLTPQACIQAVEEAFRELALGNVAAPGILGMHGFHIKTAKLGAYFAAELNANFPGNRERGLPTIQRVVVLSSAENGELLAVMDSMSITALRTAAASAVAARHLAREGDLRQKPGRTRDDEITIFDSTGTGLQDVAAAIAVYGRALDAQAGMPFNFS